MSEIHPQKIEVITQQTTISGDTDKGPYNLADRAGVGIAWRTATGHPVSLSMTVKYGTLDQDGTMVGSEETVALPVGGGVGEGFSELTASNYSFHELLLTLPDTAVLDYVAILTR